MSEPFVSIEDLLQMEWPDAFVERPGVSVLRAVRIAPFAIEPDPARGISFETAVILGERAELGLPGFDLLRVGLGGSDEPTDISGTIYPDRRLTLGPLPVSILLSHDLLVPMTRGPEVDGIRPFVRDEARQAVAVTFGGAKIDYSSAHGLRLKDPVTTTVTPFAIAGTGLILSLTDGSVILRDADWLPVLTSLGFDRDFRGIFAGAATLYWLPELQVAGLDVPGLRLDFEDLAIGTQGVSFDLDLSWPVGMAPDGTFDPTRTELMATLFDTGWQVALQRAHGSVRANVPDGLRVEGFLRVPIFDAAFSCAFGLSYRYDPETDTSAYTTSLRLAKASTNAIALPVPGGALSVTAFDATGQLSDEGFELSGQTSFALAFDGFDLEISDAALSYSHSEAEDHFSFSVGTLRLGNFATLSEVALEMTARVIEDSREISLFRLNGTCRWDDIAALIPPGGPDLGLSGAASLKALISWQVSEDPAADTKVVIELFTGASHIDGIWDFLPADFRPMVEEAEAFFRLTYASGAALAADSLDTNDLNVELSAKLKLRLPEALSTLDIPGLDLIDIEAGADGLLSAEFTATFESDDDGETGFDTGLIFEDLVAVDVHLPGGLSPDPLIETRLTKLGLKAGVTGTSAEGEILLEGDFAFRPFVPGTAPFAAQLQTLLRDVGLSDLRGAAKAKITLSDTGVAASLEGTFEEAGLRLDLFDMIAPLAKAGTPPDSPEIDVDFDIAITLSGFSLAFEYDSSAAENAFSFDFDLTLGFEMTGVPPLTARIRLSEKEFAFGLADLYIPLEMPRYPIGVADLERITDANGRWSAAELDDFATKDLDPQIETLAQALEDASDPLRHADIARTKAALEIKKLMLGLIMGVHGRVASAGHPSFEALVYADTLVHETLLGAINFDTGLYLHFPEIEINIPFDNPAGIAVSGTGQLTGLPDDHPMKPIEDYAFTLGLSADYIFAKLTGGEAIPIPDFGSPYDDGSLAINELSIAYGYNKNSFAFGFAGELIWPSRLIEDADTSKTLGAGLRLPRHNKVAFQLDVIVITIGKITLPIPLPQFDLDFRTPGAPDYLWDGTRRQPYWDGAQIIVEGALRADLKRLAFSPLFGLLPAPNLRFDGDIDIGTPTDGATLIVDDMLVFAGLVISSGAPVAVPGLFDITQPFVRTLAANLRVAGFEINFTIERPFPNPSPMALIEVFGLLSDPLMKIDPEGALANTVRITLDNAYIRVPEPVAQLCTALAGVISKPQGFTLNLGTFITLAQSAVGVVQPVAEAIETLPAPSLNQITDLAAEASALFTPAGLLEALPPELRKFRAGGSLARFSASVCFVLASWEEAEAALRARESGAGTTGATSAGLPVPAGSPSTQGEAATTLQTILDAAQLPDNVDLPADQLGGRRSFAGNEAPALFAGIEFRRFGADDLARIPLETLGDARARGPAVFLGARFRLFGGQKLRFFGVLSATGRFALVSEAEARPLELSVFGLSVPLPFAGYGRLTATGGQSRSGPFGQVTAEGAFSWSPLPGVLRLAVGDTARPARLQLHGDGQFAIAAPVTASLFDGAATLTGEAEITQEKASMTGRLTAAPQTPGQPPLVALDLEGTGVINASAQGRGAHRRVTPSFRFDARGSVMLLGQNFGGIAVSIDDHKAAFDLRFHKPARAAPVTPLEAALPILAKTNLRFDGRGEINLRRKSRPEFKLAGRGEISAIGATLRGEGGLRAETIRSRRGRAQRLTAWAEGTLDWQRRSWLGGKLSVGTDGLALSGSTRFGLKITPDRIPGPGVNIAALLLDIGLEGSFKLDPDGTNPRFQFKGDWSLGIGLPQTGGAGNPQVIPLASNAFVFNSAISFERPLFNTDGFRFLPFDGLSIPAPVVTISKASGAQTLVRAGNRTGPGDRAAVEFWTPVGTLGLQTGVQPFYTGSASMKEPTFEAYSAYAASVDWQTLSLDPGSWSDLSLGLKLQPTSDGSAFPLSLTLKSGALPAIDVPF